jgi:raffinose/stachyose/melibiose transport system substrate-binding protein
MGEGWARRFKPAALANLMVDGRVYAVPARMTLITLWANRRLLEVIDMTGEDLETWDGIMEAARRFEAAGIPAFAMGGGDVWPLGLLWNGLAQAVGGRDAFERALSGTEPGFEAPPFEMASERMSALVALDPFQTGYMDAGESEMIATFLEEEAAMMINGDWVRGRLTNGWTGADPDEDILRIPFPPSDLTGDAPPMTQGGSDGWVVHADAPDLALDFARELTGIASQRIVARLGRGIPTIAAVDTEIGDPVVRAMARELSLSNHHHLFLDQLLGPLAGREAGEALLDLASGEASPETTVARIEAAWSEFDVLMR